MIPQNKYSLVRLAHVAGLATILSLSALSADDRPNIVYFYADDMGWAGIRANAKVAQSYGVDITEVSKIITPNIDKIVAGGINFTHSYGATVCSPARSSQQTGFHQGHTWADRNDPADDKAMRTQDPTIGKVLAAAGYRNGMYGKWGYGATRDIDAPVITNQQTIPIEHGYHDCVVELHHIRAHTFLQPTLWYSHIARDGTITLPTTLLDNRKQFPEYDLYADNYFAAGAMKFIREEAKEPSPFFVQVSFQVPHAPFDEIETVEGWFDDYADTDTSTWDQRTKWYAAMMTLMDKRIGEIMATLRDPNGDGDESDSLMADTLVIFSSDNGGARNPMLEFFNANGHLKGFKTGIDEGSLRTPLAFYWEGVIEPGQTTDFKTCVTDIFPTFCELAGVEAPVGLDGVSIAPLITGKGKQRIRPHFSYEANLRDTTTWAVIRDDIKLIKRRDGSFDLYDIKKDPSESDSLINKAQYAKTADLLKAIAYADNLDAHDFYANVWPTWIGKDGADVNDASSWQETGEWPFERKWPQSETPTENWNAVVTNTTGKDQTVRLKDSINVLGLEVRGDLESGSKISLKLSPKITLNGRNEVRMAPLSVTYLNGARLRSMRWVELNRGARLVGHGKISSDFYVSGELELSILKEAPSLTVSGSLTLNGTLAINAEHIRSLEAGESRVIIEAKSVEGNFNNPDDLVKTENATFQIIYKEDSVSLKRLS